MVKVKDFDDIDIEDVGTTIAAKAEIVQVIQTSGPTLFLLNDGTGQMKGKAFAGPGQRAYPDIEESDTVYVELKIHTHKDNIEGNIIDIDKISRKEFKKSKNQKLEDKIKTNDSRFLIEHAALKKLMPRFKEAAQLIREAIYSNRPILVRHHSDCDGYSAAIALQRAILDLLESHHKDDTHASWNYYTRAPSTAPFYDYQDALRDLTGMQRNADKHYQKMPLVVLLDHGSTDESLQACKTLKMYGSDIIVVDHHPADFDNIKQTVDIFINPHDVEGGDSNLTAGMLGTELARLVNPDLKDIENIPIIAGIADKATGAAYDRYLQLADVDIEFLEKTSEVIDFIAYQLNFLESRQLVDDIYSIGSKKQQELVDMFYAEIEKKKQNAKDTVKKYLETENINDIELKLFDIDATTTDGYPTSGTITGLVLQDCPDNSIIIGHRKDSVTLRVGAAANFSTKDLITYLQEEVPHAQVNGGGHARAGSIRFVAVAKKDIMQHIKKYIEKEND